MIPFNHVNATTLAEVKTALAKYERKDVFTLFFNQIRPELGFGDNQCSGINYFKSSVHE